GQGARTTVAITLLVRHPGRTGRAVVRYRDIGDYLTREQKLDIIAAGDLHSVDWQAIAPNDAGDWINQRTLGFGTYTAITSKDPRERAIFRVNSGGLKTNRDAWVYSFSRTALGANVTRMVDFYNTQVDDFRATCEREGIRDPKAHVDAFINLDPTRFSWDRADKPRLARGAHYTSERSSYRVAVYRPFSKQAVYFDRILNNTVYQLPSIFPKPMHANHGIYITGVSSPTAFAAVAVDAVPDVQLLGNGQFLPRWTYEPVELADTQGAFDLNDGRVDIVAGYRRVDNITDEALAEHRTAFGPDVTRDDVFYYVYGLLHSPDYRTTFAADLKKMLPRIPRVPSVEDFCAFAAAGRELATLHIGYESVTAYPLRITGEPGPGVVGQGLYDWYRVEKMRFGGAGKAKDRSTVVYNSRVTVAGIPEEAYEYLLGSRSAIEWILERYQVKTDKASGIVNDPNDWAAEVGDPRYILDLLARIVTVSVETVRIVKSLPPIDFSQVS
ncbi:MAG TPA: type ISP restriction/modification enzyme, partial [Coriobacteriia bacterium]|nr:type ISP restriction/modification enzyme [Coriobacteriia bacterium]